MIRRRVNIRYIDSAEVSKAVADTLIKANVELCGDVERAIMEAANGETNAAARYALDMLCNNAAIARRDRLPICQDTGMVTVFVDIGEEVRVDGISAAINRGVREGCEGGYLRRSVVDDPLFDRVNTGDNTPCIIYYNVVPGNALRMHIMPKGFGSENTSRVKMLTPANTHVDVLDFVVETVRKAGGNACPPLIIGVGIGGDFAKCTMLAKHALLREVGSHNRDHRYAELERDILCAVNATGVGAMGFGGDVTALQVSVEHHPTHIAGLPVAVNISCHATRHGYVAL